MAITKLNSLAIPPNTIVESDLSYPLTNFSSTGIDDNATSTAITIDASENVGIGTASPTANLEISAATSRKIDVVDTTGARVRLSTASGQTFVGSTTAHPLNIITSDVVRATVDASGNTYIGAGSATQYLRFKTGAIGTDGGVQWTFNTDSTIFGSLTLPYDTRASVGLHLESAYPATYTVPGNQAHKFVCGGAEAARITSTGIGIGTTSPDEKLEVYQGNIKLGTATNTTSKLIFERSAVDRAEIYVGSSNQLQFDLGGSERMRIDSSGNVGIGTTATANTRVYVRTALATDVAYLADNSTNSGFKVKFNSGSTAILNDFNAPLIFGTNDTERMRIDSSGNVLVGTTTTVGTGTEGVQIQTNGSIITGRNQTSDQIHHIFKNPNGTVGTIRTLNNATSYVTSSDQRLKENIVDAPAGNIDAIRVRSFDWKADGTHQTYGMVAQELVDVAPEAVSQGETEEDMWGVDYSKLVPMMIKEIQDLKAEVAALKGA